MEDESSFDSFIVADTASRKRKSVLPINKTGDNSSGSVELDEEESAHVEVNKKRRSVLLSKLQNRTVDRSRLQKTLSTNFLSENQIQDQYEYAMKLHMGNKINDKNVYSLNLKLAEVLFQRYQKGGNVNFQRAAMDVEAGFKIWSYRVDAVHKDCTRAVKDLIETNAALSQGEEDDEINDEEGDQAGGAKDEKKMRRKRKMQQVVYEDGTKISDKKLIEVKNPYLAIRAAKLDSATDIAELKLSTTGVDGDTGGVHPNEDAPLIARPVDDADDDEKENDEWLDLLRDDFDALTKEIETMKDIAPSFNRHSLGDHLTTPVPAASTQQKNQSIMNNDPITDAPPPLSFEPDMADYDDNVDYDDFDEAPPMPPSFAQNENEVRSIIGDDAASHIFGNAAAAADSEPVFEPMMMDTNQTGNNDEDARSSVSIASSRASSTVTAEMYTGASKFLANVFDNSIKFRKPRLPPRIVANAAAASNGEMGPPVAPTRPKRKRVKVADRINQAIDLDAEWDDAIVYTNAPKSRRKKDTADREKHLIGESELNALKSANQHSLSTTLEFCLRELRYICIGYDNKTVDEDEVENETAEQNNVDNDHESEHEPLSNLISNFSKLGEYDDDVPEAFDPPSDELLGDGDELPSGEHEGGLPVPNVPGEQSLLKVKQVDRIKMNYDKRARRVNVRVVKNEMWGIIEDARDKSLSEEKENLENDAEPDLASVQATTFSELRLDLDDKLEGDNRENLTPAMALVCVLYLANEKNLELEQNDEMNNDFLIRAPQTKSTSQQNA